MSFNDNIRKLPLAKLLVLCFSIFTCFLIILDAAGICKLTDISADLLKWLGSTVIIGYFGKSAYEHKINSEKRAKNE